MKKILCARSIAVLLAAFGVVMFALAGGAQAISFSDVDLGVVNTDNLGVLVTGNNNLTNSGGADTINGGLGKLSTVTSSWTVNGTTYTLTSADISPVVTNLNTISGLSASTGYTSWGGGPGTISPSGPINAYGGHDTVVRGAGGIGLSGTTLTITGGANDYYIFYLPGGINVNSGNILLSGTIPADHVLFYASGGDIISNNASVLNGTFYSAQQINITGATVNGALICPKIFDLATSGIVTVNADPYYYGSDGSTAVPEPGTLLLLGSGLIGLCGARKKFKK